MSDEDRDDRMKDRLSGRFNTGEDNDDKDKNDAVDVVEDNDDKDKNDAVDVVEDNDNNDKNDAVDVVEDNDNNDKNDAVDVVEDNDDNNEADSNGDVGQEQRSVRDTTGRTFYVGEDTLDDLDALYKELEFRYYQKHGDDLPKNKQFYPALFDVVVENPDLVAEKLGLDSDAE